MRILIGALSCWQYQERRDRCAQTWMQEGDKLNGSSPSEPSQARHTIARSVFLIGIPELKAPELAGRYLLLPGPSDYRSLPQRTRAFCQWAISRDDWDYLFKCDDDTYVSISRLVRYPLTADYIGAEWAPGVRYASGGAGYFLSRKAAQVVAEHLTQKEGPEDVFVRDTLASQGIPFTKDQRFVALGNEELRPRADNDLITLHCVPSVPADLFYKSHQECTGAALPERFSAEAVSDQEPGRPCDQDGAQRRRALIPNVIHFCFGLSPDHGGKPFSLIHYLAVRSAVEVNRPDAVRFYYCYEPSGEWWERARPYLDLVHVELLDSLYGVPNPHFAHQADFLRLKALEEHGGVYLDIDVLCLRSFEPLRRHEIVLGEEGKDGLYGLCNAVILSQPGSWFVRKWLEGFDPTTSLWQGFRASGHDAHWNELSVRYPAHLAKLYPDRVHVVDHRAFFWPTWRKEDLDLLYRGTGTSFADAYCVHLWEHVAWERYLKDLDVDYIRSVDTNFNRLARRFLDPEHRSARPPLDPVGDSHDACSMPTHLDPYPPLSPRLSPEDLLCLKEGQQQLTRMLKYLFEEVCEPHGIQALAWGGTLIGAVNYGGWVPWDADADMLVHRDDFERFKAQIRASCPADFWYQSRETDPHYDSPIEKLRFLHAHYAGSERYPWHGGLQVDICQFWIENGVFVTSAPDHDATLGQSLREEHILPSIELLFDGVRMRTFRDPAAYLKVRYRTEPLQSERNVPVEQRYPHEGAVRLGASAADWARYPQLYEHFSLPRA